MLRVFLAVVVGLAVSAVVGKLTEPLGSWGPIITIVAGMFAVSAVIPHYMYRGEPLLPKRPRRD
jgi:hypothetical protein